MLAAWILATVYHVTAMLLVPTMDNAGTCAHPQLIPSHGDSLLVFVEVFPFEYYQFAHPDPGSITQYWKARGDTIRVNYPTERRVYHFVRATCWRKVVRWNDTHYNIGCPYKTLKVPQ